MTQEGVFRPEDILEWVRRRPFEPFRLCMSDGREFDVRHPELVMVDPRTVFVGQPLARREGVAERIHHCAMIHITRLERLAEAG